MPYFQFRATDSAGQVKEGTLQAGSLDEARQHLSKAALKVMDVRPAGGAVAASAPVATQQPRPASTPRAPVTAPRPTAPRMQQPVAPVRMPAVETPAAMVVNSVAGGSSIEPVRTKFGNDKQNFLIFSQLTAMLRSGIAPYQAFNHLADKARKPEYQAALRDIGQMAAERGAMSDGFEKYPYLFPPDIASTIRAGELSGNLVEACNEVSNHADQSYRLKRRFFYFSAVLVFALVYYPIAIGIVKGSHESIAAQFDADGQLPVAKTLFYHMRVQIGKQIPITAAVAAALLLFRLYWRSMKARMLRHQAVLMMPGLAKRAQSESLARMAWVMTQASKSGLPAMQVAELGAASMQNLVMREKMLTEVRSLGHSEKISVALDRSGLLPPEARDMVANGELMGDVPGALQNVYQMNESEYQIQNTGAVWRAGSLFYLGLGVIIAIILYNLYVLYFQGMFDLLMRAT